MVLIGSVTPSGAATTWSYNYAGTTLADGKATPKNNCFKAAPWV